MTTKDILQQAIASSPIEILPGSTYIIQLPGYLGKNGRELLQATFLKETGAKCFVLEGGATIVKPDIIVHIHSDPPPLSDLNHTLGTIIAEEIRRTIAAEAIKPENIWIDYSGKEHDISKLSDESLDKLATEVPGLKPRAAAIKKERATLAALKKERLTSDIL